MTPLTKITFGVSLPATAAPFNSSPSVNLGVPAKTAVLTVSVPSQPGVTPPPADSGSPGDLETQVPRLIESFPSGPYTPSSQITMGSL